MTKRTALGGNTIRLAHVSAAVMVVSAVSLLADIRLPQVYRNDFSTRESLRLDGFPGAWIETPIGTYPALTTSSPSVILCDSVGKYSTSVHGSEYDAFATKSYDGWYVPYLAAGYKLYFRSALVSEEDTNPAATFTSIAENQLRRSQVCLHPIGNSFTSGVVRVQIDMRPPDYWVDGSTSLQCVRIGPVFRKYMPVMSWGGANKSTSGAMPGCAGIARSTNYDPVQTLWTTAGKGDKYLMAKGKWYRIVADYDLDAKEYGASAYDLGSEHPTFESTGSLIHSWPTNIPFVASYDGLDGALTGIGISAATISPLGASLVASTNKLFTDNIAVSWKRPGDSEFVRCYENDFAKRRIRRVSLPETVRSSYSDPVSVDSDVASTFTDYKSHGGGYTSSQVQLVPAALTTPLDASVQPVGLDGWRRLAYDAKGNGFIFCGSGRDYAGDAGASLMVSGSDRYAIPAQSLGEKIESGKVRFTVDVRVPRTDAAAVGTASRYVSAMLGGAALYTANSGTIDGNVCAEVGFDVGDPVNSAYPVTSYRRSASAKTFGAAGAVSTWYRIEMVADLDAKTYDFTVTQIGETGIKMADVAGGEPVFSQTGVPFASAGVSDVGSFALHGYGQRDDTGNYPTFTYFDNIGVWKDYGTASEKMIYSNDFACCRRDVTVKRAAGYLSNQYFLDDGGDGWLRLDGLSGATRYTLATIRGDANRCACLSSGSSGSTGFKARYTQPLAFDLAERGTFSFKADIRPPQLYSAASGFAYLELTGRRAEVVAARADYDDDVSVRVGFDGVSAYEGKSWTSKLHGADGVAIDVGRWYRFVVAVDVGAKTSRIRVHDQGGAQPEMTDANGTLVTEMNDVPFVDATCDGITSISIVGSRMPYQFAGDAGVDSPGMLVDNISISVRSGAVFIVR